MAESFEPFHVPQQSRRDKLRVVLDSHNNNYQEEEEEEEEEALDGCGALGLLPSLIPSYMLTCGQGGNSRPSPYTRNPVYCVKQEGRNPNMGYYVGGFINTSAPSSSSSSPSSSHHHPYSLDPHPNVRFSSIQDINNNNNNNNNLLSTSHQSHREFDPCLFNRDDEGVVVAPTSTPMYRSQALPLTNDSQRLSLSLSSHHQQLNLPQSLGGGVSVSNDIRSAVPLGPFTGYSSILKGSRFLGHAQQLLEDVCYVGRCVDRSCGDSSSAMDLSVEVFSEDGSVNDLLACSDRSGHRKKRTRLISLLNEVYKRYKLYCQQMQTIVASFESVAGLANAAPYTSFALRGMSKHFQNLKNAITDQLRFSNKSLGEESFKKEEPPWSAIDDIWTHGQRTTNNPVCVEHQHVWRPQRGLPERAVAVLRAWLFDHFLHPYPTDTDKQTLAKQTGLSRSQVSNWFINARVRLWKPMVEEIHMLETCQSQKTCDGLNQNSSNQSEAFLLENASRFNKQTEISSALFKVQDHALKRSRSEHHPMPAKASEAMKFSYNTTSSHSHVEAGHDTSGGNSGVSLTLGLQQNNGIGFSEPLPLNIARRFGLDASNEGYIGSFDAPSHHFSKIPGGHFLHDFVG